MTLGKVPLGQPTNGTGHRLQAHTLARAGEGTVEHRSLRDREAGGNGHRVKHVVSTGDNDRGIPGWYGSGSRPTDRDRREELARTLRRSKHTNTTKEPRNKRNRRYCISTCPCERWYAPDDVDGRANDLVLNHVVVRELVKQHQDTLQPRRDQGGCARRMESTLTIQQRRMLRGSWTPNEQSTRERGNPEETSAT